MMPATSVPMKRMIPITASHSSPSKANPTTARIAHATSRITIAVTMCTTVRACDRRVEGRKSLCLGATFDGAWCSPSQVEADVQTAMNHAQSKMPSSENRATCLRAVECEARVPVASLL